MPQQREYSICITLLLPQGVDAEKKQTFLLVLSHLAAEGNTALCQIKRPTRFTNGLEAPDRGRLEVPMRHYQTASLERRFHPSLWQKRSAAVGESQNIITEFIPVSIT